MRSAILCLAVLLAVLACCAREPVYTPTPTTRVPSVTPRPTQDPPATGAGRPTAAPSCTSTPRPAATRAPTATPIPPHSVTPSPTGTATDASSPTPLPPPAATPLPTLTPVPTATESPPTAVPQAVFDPPPGRQFAGLDAFWNGQAEWVLDEFDTGLPGGESDTVYRGGLEFWAYLHASHQSAGVVDQCGDPVPFPGCTTLWKSYDGGRRFVLENPVCLFQCAACPCDQAHDHIGQQQYPRVSFQGDQAYLVYEFGAFVYLRTSADGIHWSAPLHVPGTGIWYFHNYLCHEAETIGEHPHVYREFEWDCLVGGPPGIYTEGDQLFIFVGLGKAPGHMGCLAGNRTSGVWGLRKCSTYPLFGAELGYGPVEALGVEANPYFEFRTISSADVVRVGERFYMTYEGIRGPSNPNVVDDQFGLGLARSAGPSIDGPWERFAGNPIIMDLPGNVGVGHADLVLVDNLTFLYTSTSSFTRGRYVLVWR
jgi:hypothetical protein